MEVGACCSSAGLCAARGGDVGEGWDNAWKEERGGCHSAQTRLFAARGSCG